MVMMSTVSLKGFVEASVGPSSCCCCWPPPGVLIAGIVVIVVTVDEDELVLLAVDAFMPISMLVSADETCSRFSIRIW